MSDKDYTTAAAAYYSREELNRQREDTRRATQHAADYVASELEKAKARSERRRGRQ